MAKSQSLLLCCDCCPDSRGGPGRQFLSMENPWRREPGQAEAAESWFVAWQTVLAFNWQAQLSLVAFLPGRKLRQQRPPRPPQTPEEMTAGNETRCLVLPTRYLCFAVNSPLPPRPQG